MKTHLITRENVCFKFSTALFRINELIGTCVDTSCMREIFLTIHLSLSTSSVFTTVAPVIGFYYFTYWKRHKFVVHAYRTTLCNIHTQQKCNSIEYRG